jgi:hypothetical protein
VNDEVPLAPHRLSALVAPAIDRVFIAGMRAARDGGTPALGQRYGGPAATGFLIDFRTRLAAPDGVVSGAGFTAVTRYGDPNDCQRTLDKQVAHGMIYRLDDGGFGATPRGRAFLADVYELHARVTEELWGGQPERMARLIDRLGRMLAAAATETGDAFHAVGPPYEPDGTPPGVLLLNRLGTLRYHRADAHAAAWTAAGHTARGIVSLAPGPERLAIELETDRRAAGPYAVLTPSERLALLADLAAMPG